ncbi:MAG: hypothetical protein HN337_04800 [Deltaproteobacteria bacterium]|jgi:hypothetical protein|nr:hypothetical protein [Deltaproteobacteria bacterium]
MPACVFCGHEVDLEFKIGRLEECRHCGHYLHACMQCTFYDRSYHNKCRENQARLVSDKEGSNFCEFFKFGREVDKEKADIQKAKSDLEAIFKKG